MSNLQIDRDQIVAKKSFRRGAFDYHRAHFNHAKTDLRKSEDLFWRRRDFDSFLEACSYRVRIFAERGETLVDGDEFKERLFRALTDESIQGSQRARAYQILALAALSNSPDRYDQAKSYYLRSLDVGLEPHERGCLGSALYGLAFIAMGESSYQEALELLARLEVILRDFPDSYLETKALLLKAMALRETGRLEEAQNAAWTAYSSLSESPDFFHYIHSLNMLANLAIDKKCFEMAEQYLGLARAAIRDSGLVRVSGIIERATARLAQAKEHDRFDLRFSSETLTLTNSSGQSLSFGGRVMLRELCLLFVTHPQAEFGKEEVIRRIWNEVYDPDVHANKLYVSIQRLRRLMEESGFLSSNLPLIVRCKGGYRLNPALRVQIIRD